MFSDPVAPVFAPGSETYDRGVKQVRALRGLENLLVMSAGNEVSHRLCVLVGHCCAAGKWTARPRVLLPPSPAQVSGPTAENLVRLRLVVGVREPLDG